MNYKFTLIDTSTGQDQRHWILPPPVIVGRSPDAPVSINDPSISRRHCQFIIDAQGALVVRDLDSLNGTYIDDVRVSKKVLLPGTLVRMGALTFRIEWTTETALDRLVPGTTGDLKATQPLNILPKRKP